MEKMAASYELVEVRFEDPVAGKSVVAKVSPADAERAGNGKCMF
jgi:hypothetical protein